MATISEIETLQQIVLTPRPLLPKGRAGDAANIVLSAVGHNFHRILAWLRELLSLFLGLLSRTIACPSQLNPAS